MQNIDLFWSLLPLLQAEIGFIADRNSRKTVFRDLRENGSSQSLTLL